MKTIKASIFIAVVMLLAFASCKKDAGYGKANEINGTVTLNGAAVSGAVVYLYVGAKDGSGTAKTSAVSDASGQYMFGGLNKGDYFVNATYRDQNTGFTYHSGGAAITIGSKKKGKVTADLTVE